MTKQKKYLFKHQNNWLGRQLVRLGLAPLHKNIPVFGIQGAGKSYFIMSVAYFISQRSLGRVIGESADYVTRFIPLMMKGERLDATVGYKDIDLEVSRIYAANYNNVCYEVPGATARVVDVVRQQPPSVTDLYQPTLGEDSTEQQIESETIPCEFFISTNDLSGAEFKNAMERLSEPTLDFHKDPQIRRFTQILKDGEGAIVVVDVVRREITSDAFSQDRIKHIRNALAEQVAPIAKGIQLSIIEGNKKNKVFPLFLVFTKHDIHQLSRFELERIIKEAFAIQIAGFEEYVKIRIHSVQNMGFGVDPESIIDLERRTEGIGLFLADLYFWINEM
jgi:hypothetical protein